MPDFSEKSKQSKRSKRLPRRELLTNVGRRATFPVRGSISTRATFHNVPVDLPPLPGTDSNTRILLEHGYS